MVSVDTASHGFGGIVTDVDLARLSDADWHVVHDAFLRHAVLVFPDQHLDVEPQKDLARRLGPLELIDGQEALRIGNVREDGSLVTPSADERELGYIRGNEGWHTDSSYMPVSARASILSAHLVPPSGSATEWADARAAFEALPDEVRDRVKGLSARHSLVESQRRRGFPVGSHRSDLSEPPLRPLVKVHPETGRPGLYVGRHAYEVPGLETQDALELLDWLNEFITQPERVHRHVWSGGEVVMWDNRCVLHRATPWDLSEPRLMVHTRVAGDPETEGSEENP